MLTCRSPQEHAAYKLLLDFIHSHGGDLPDGELCTGGSQQSPGDLLPVTATQLPSAGSGAAVACLLA